ncbi:MAG: DNA-methyltransferase [Acidimicrobiales bacterium]
MGHPAPFPVELPEQLIRLDTFKDDLVLDPFMGSGSALVAAARLGRRYVGYDLDESYVEIARRRVAEVLTPAWPRLALEAHRQEGTPPAESELEDFPDRARRVGKAAHQVAAQVLTDAVFTIEQRGWRVSRTGVAVTFLATDEHGATWFFDLAGAFVSHRGGMLRTDAVWMSLGRASAVKGRFPEVPLVLLTTNLPRHPSEGDTALRAAGAGAFFDAIEVLSDQGRNGWGATPWAGSRTTPNPGSGHRPTWPV